MSLLYDYPESELMMSRLAGLVLILITI
jgi:hypothetical protein